LHDHQDPSSVDLDLPDVGVSSAPSRASSVRLPLPLNVNDRLRRQARHGSAAHMFDHGLTADEESL